MSDSKISDPKKYVITGASCSGKSTLVRELGIRGFYVTSEVAKKYILEQQKKGISEPWLRLDFQPALLELQFANELGVPPDVGVAFLDRAIPDALAYFKYRQQAVPKDLACRVNDYFSRKQYKKIFLLEPLTFFERDGFRVENDKTESEIIAHLVKAEYSGLGCSPILVPNIGVDKRISFLLANLD